MDSWGVTSHQKHKTSINLYQIYQSHSHAINLYQQGIK